MNSRIILSFVILQFTHLCVWGSCNFNYQNVQNEQTGDRKNFVLSFRYFVPDSKKKPRQNQDTTDKAYDNIFTTLFMPYIGRGGVDLGKKYAYKEMQQMFDDACQNKNNLMSLWPFVCKSNEYVCSVFDVIKRYNDFVKELSNLSGRTKFIEITQNYGIPPGFERIGLGTYYIQQYTTANIVQFFKPSLNLYDKIRGKDSAKYTIQKYLTVVLYFALSGNKNGLNTFNNMFNGISKPSICSGYDSKENKVFCVVAQMKTENSALVAEMPDWDKKSKEELIPWNVAENIIRYLLKATVWKYIDDNGSPPYDDRDPFPLYEKNTVIAFLQQYTPRVLFRLLVNKDFAKLTSLIKFIKQSNLYYSSPNTFSSVLFESAAEVIETTTAGRQKRIQVLITMCCKKDSNLKIDAADLSALAETVFESIYSKVYANDRVGMAKLIKQFPPIPELKKEGSKPCVELQGDNTRNPRCIFEGVFNSVNVLISSQVPTKIETKIMFEDNADSGKLKALITQNIIGNLQRNQQQQQANHLQIISKLKTMMSDSSALGGLKTYFNTMATYDEAKATADIGYIKGRLASFQASITELQPALEDQMKKLIKGAIIISAGDMASLIVKGIASAAAAANPFNADPADVMEKLDEIANKAVEIAEAGLLLTKHLPVLATTGKSITSRMKENDVFIKKVIALVELAASSDSSSSFKTSVDEFLIQYTAYDPKVRKNELVGYAKQWDLIVESACDIMFTDTGTVVTAPARIIALNEGSCEKSKVNIVRINEIFMEMYEYQFDMMETLATALRAKISGKAAKNLDADISGDTQQEIDDLNEKEIELRKSALSSFVLYRIDLLNKLKGYCDIIEYQYGGNKLRRCQSALRSLSYQDLTNLVEPPIHVCKHNVLSLPLSVPTTQEKFIKMIRIKGHDYHLTRGPASPLEGNLNLDDLYAGTYTVLKIPSAQWLVDNHWINPERKDRPTFIKSFELFVLPTENKDVSRRVSTSVQTYDLGSFSPVGPRYFAYRRSQIRSHAIQPLSTESTYTENQSCMVSKTDNAYDHRLPQICIAQRGAFPHIYPSVFSTFRVKMTIDPSNSSPKPQPMTPLFLKVGIELCTPNEGTLKRKRRSLSTRSTTTIKKCPTKSYWSQKENKCKSCPAGSVPALFGYYCKRAPMQKS